MSVQTLSLTRHFSAEGTDPYDAVTWVKRTAEVGTFRQEDVEFPESWSQDAVNIVAQKYFRGQLGTDEREHSLRQVIGRVVRTVTLWAYEQGTVGEDPEAKAFADELTTLILEQRFAFNSPVWFNIGVPCVKQQASACFILHVDDNLNSILEWYRQEGLIFKGGSGAGVNVSALRGSDEPLGGGGTASGPVSFMRGADASAGTIKSGGKTRRAAKMVLLDDDHPDIQEFIWCKAHEEKKARALAAAGFDVGVNGADLSSLQYQNANNSVRLSDAFLHAVESGQTWSLNSRGTPGFPLRTVDAADLLEEIAQAAWECADPGIQFKDTINSWHTLAAHSPINASNPCSEYLSIDDSACNLGSINLLRYLHEGHFDIAGFQQTVRIAITAMDALAGMADYPTDLIGENSRAYRQLGLGYTNLGALLMSLGLPYDSDNGRAVAGAITALMGGEAYLTSAKLATLAGPFNRWEVHKRNTMHVLERHTGAAEALHDELRSRNGEASPIATVIARAGVEAWQRAVSAAENHGVRNAQTTVLAPTGTISFLLDADTTGVEPDFALVKHKTLVGGGTMRLVNQTILPALERLGYEDAASRVGNLQLTGDLDVRPEHYSVFACAVGPDAIDYMGHVKMLAAVQPFLSGAASKTVNLPSTATVADIQELILDAWKLGVKCLAVYRDGSKNAQPLETPPAVAPPPAPVRRKLPQERPARTFSFRVSDCHGYVTVGEYEDGSPGELFLRVARQGSTLAGVMDAFAVSVSHGLQHGVPLLAYCKAFIGSKFEPAGITDDASVRIVSSLIDYVFRRLALTYLPPSELELLPFHETKAAAVEEAPTPRPTLRSPGEVCMSCGGELVQAGSCFACPFCGSTTGCS